VPLGLVKREQKERPRLDRDLDPSADRGSELYQVETTPIEHDDFLQAVIDQQPEKHIVILGEPGAGKTTLLTRVWQSLLDNANPEAPVIIAWIPLAALGNQSLQKHVEESWLAQVCEDADQKAALASFTSLRQTGKVYLLLDGADEIGGDGLQKIAEYLRMPWAKSLKVVVTCRLNLWDGSARNELKQNFQIFRTLDFKYANSAGQDEVAAFIGKWFDDVEAGKGLRAALDEDGKERIKDLAQNPLRLTLLCNIWQREQGLPDTQAGLYERFVRYVYSWSKVPDAVEMQLELDRVMGILAKYGINKPSLRFRFTERELQEQVPDLGQRKVLKALGWLNCVGVDESDQEVYAFFHPTFQEYFAACSIDDWDYFLPRAHVDRPVACLGEDAPTYRGFVNQWQQVILLWIGRQDIDEKCKEDFLVKLTNFEDDGSNTYHYISYCFACSLIPEAKKIKQRLKITKKVAKWIIYDEEIHNLSTIKSFLAAKSALESNSINHVIEHLYLFLIEIDESLLELMGDDGLDDLFFDEEESLNNSDSMNVNSSIINQKIKRRRCILEALKMSPQITITLYEYLWNFSNNEKFDLKSAYFSYQISTKHSKTYSGLQGYLSLEAFKSSEQYGRICKYRPKKNRTRRYKEMINSTPEFSRYKSKKIKKMFENFDNSVNESYKNLMISEIKNDKNYFLYDTRKKIIKALEYNQDLNEYFLDLLYKNEEDTNLIYRIARFIKDFGHSKMESINKLLELIENANDMSCIVELSMKLCQVTFAIDDCETEEVSCETIRLVVRCLLSRMVNNSKISWRSLIQEVKDTFPKEMIGILLSEIKLCLMDDKYECQQVEYCYELVFYCAQTISYPEFHTAWHQH
jgi:GTPase SAR1 family protein